VEDVVGAKFTAEPYVELDASSSFSADQEPEWNLDLRSGLEGTASSDIQVFGRPLFKPIDFSLFDYQLSENSSTL